MATLFILYGSATGNSKHIAQELALKYKDANSSLLPTPFTSVICCEGDNFKKQCVSIWETPPINDAKRHGLIVITATTGNGDPPENIGRFFRFLKRKSTPKSKPFQHVAFSVLGLGDTNYDKFCETAKIIDKKLLECAGERCMKLACADEATGLEDVVEDWIENIVNSLAHTALGNACTEENLNEEEKKEEDDEVDTKIIIDNSISTELDTTPLPVITGNSREPHALSKIPTGDGKGTLHDHPFVENKLTIPLVRSETDSFVASKPTTQTSNESRLNLPTSIHTISNSTNINSSTPVTPASTKAVLTVNQEDNLGKNLKHEKSNSPLFILFGSATGNAQSIAQDLQLKYEKQLKTSPNTCFFPSVVCCELDQFKKKCTHVWEEQPSSANVKRKHGIIIVTSTTGNGDAPENAGRFARYIKRKSTIETSPFRYCAYAVLALGDTNYDQFCATGKLVDRKLVELGGTRVKALACADEGTGLEDVVETWVSEIVPDLTEACRGKCDANFKVISVITKKVGKLVEEEKKMDTEDFSSIVEEKVLVPSMEIQSKDLSSSSSAGLSMIRRMFFPSRTSSVIPVVEQNDIPLIGSNLSSCEFVNERMVSDIHPELSKISLEDAECMTTSSLSSSGICYTAKKPFESCVRNARYLTNTDSLGVKLANNALCCTTDDQTTEEDKHSQAMRFIDEQLPLVTNDSSDKSLCERNGKRVIEMELSLPDDYSLEYQPGDSIGMIVPNSPEAVALVMQMLKENHGISSQQKVTVEGHPVMTVEQLIRDHVDLCSPLKNKRILASFSQVADHDEKAVLRLLASSTHLGRDMYEQFIVKQSRNAFDILRDFPSCQAITLNGLLAVLPEISPRYYSISSSPLISKSTSPSLTVAFSVVDYMTPLQIPDDQHSNRRVGGLATRFLEVVCSPFLCSTEFPTKNDEIEDFSKRTLIKIFPKPTSDFHLPQDPTTPLVLVGPGTGIAPFIGFLDHRKAEAAAMDVAQAAKVTSEGTWRGGFDIEDEDLSVTRSDVSGLMVGVDYSTKYAAGEIDVYFGCRFSSHDWLFRDELATHEKEGTISKLNVSFSRDNGKKQYVQHRMKNDSLCAERLVRLIVKQNGSLYICGDGNRMGKDVQSAFVEIIAKNVFGGEENELNDNSLKKAEAYLQEMKKNGRFLMDIWS